MSPVASSRISVSLFACLAVVGGLVPLAACGGGTPPDVSSDPDASTTTPAPTPTTPPTAAPTATNNPQDASPPTDGGDGGDASAKTFCEFRTTKCRRTQASCDKERTCFDSMRAGVGASIEACVLARNQCNVVDDCLGLEAIKHASSGVAPSFKTACFAAGAACPGTIRNNTCEGLAVFPDATLTTIQTCFAKPCNELSACVEAELGKLSCD